MEPLIIAIVVLLACVCWLGWGWWNSHRKYLDGVEMMKMLDNASSESVLHWRSKFNDLHRKAGSMERRIADAVQTIAEKDLAIEKLQAACDSLAGDCVEAERQRDRAIEDRQELRDAERQWLDQIEQLHDENDRLKAKTKPVKKAVAKKTKGTK